MSISHTWRAPLCKSMIYGRGGMDLRGFQSKTGPPLFTTRLSGLFQNHSQTTTYITLCNPDHQLQTLIAANMAKKLEISIGIQPFYIEKETAVPRTLFQFRFRIKRGQKPVHPVEWRALSSSQRWFKSKILISKNEAHLADAVGSTFDFVVSQREEWASIFYGRNKCIIAVPIEMTRSTMDGLSHLTPLKLNAEAVANNIAEGILCGEQIHFHSFNLYLACGCPLQ